HRLLPARVERAALAPAHRLREHLERAPSLRRIRRHLERGRCRDGARPGRGEARRRTRSHRARRRRLLDDARRRCLLWLAYDFAPGHPEGEARAPPLELRSQAADEVGEVLDRRPRLRRSGGPRRPARSRRGSPAHAEPPGAAPAAPRRRSAALPPLARLRLRPRTSRRRSSRAATRAALASRGRGRGAPRPATLTPALRWSSALGVAGPQ